MPAFAMITSNGSALSEQLIGAVSDACETGQIEFDESEASTIGRRVLSYLSSRRFGLGQVARRTTT